MENNRNEALTCAIYAAIREMLGPKVTEEATNLMSKIDTHDDHYHLSVIATTPEELCAVALADAKCGNAGAAWNHVSLAMRTSFNNEVLRNISEHICNIDAKTDEIRRKLTIDIEIDESVTSKRLRDVFLVHVTGCNFDQDAFKQWLSCNDIAPLYNNQGHEGGNSYWKIFSLHDKEKISNYFDSLKE